MSSAPKLPPEVNRILFVRQVVMECFIVRNLPFKISAEDMYDLFGKYGPVRQIRIGNQKDTRGTAFVVYEDIFDAKNACEHLSGFNVQGRYLIVLYFQPSKQLKKLDLEKRREEIEMLRTKYQKYLNASLGQF